VRSRFVIPAAILVAVAYVKGRQHAQVPDAARTAPAVPGPTHASILRAQAEAADAREVGHEDIFEADLAVAEAAAALAEAPVVEQEELLHEEPELPAEPEAPEEAVAEAPVVPGPLWIPDLDAVPVPAAAPSVFAPRGPAWEPDHLALSEWVGTPAGAARPVEASGRFALGGWAVQAGHMAVCGVTFPSRIAGDVAAGRIRLVPDALQNVSPAGLVVLGDVGFAPDGDGFTLLVAATAPGAFAASGRYELVG